jgi:hypothetical protein
VLVNGPSEVWVERDGGIERTPVRFSSAAAVTALVQRVVAPLGLRVDEARPWVDARLPGGERFHAVLPPLAPDGPVVTIRTFARHRLDLRALIDREALDPATAQLLEAMVGAGVAIAVSGATGTGKTTLLNVLERQLLCPANYRSCTCLLITKLLQDMVEVAAEGGHVGVVGAEGGLADLQGPFVLGAGAGQVAKVGQHRAEVAVPGGHVEVVGAEGGLADL